jgi:diguanylate cyclase (GGDEF)-like protein
MPKIPAVPNLSSLGIRAHLLLAFACVAVLAVALNLLAEHGSLIIRTRTEAAPPVPVIVQPRLQGAEDPPAPSRTFELDRLSATVDRFIRAAFNRATDPVPVNTEQLKMVTAALRDDAVAYVASAAGALPSKHVSALTNRVSELEVRGTELVRLGDARTARFSSLQSAFETLDVRMKDSVDRAWKIFGRVIASQSLIVLSRHLDDLRRDLVSLLTPGGFDAARLAKVRESEAAFAKALDEVERGLTRSQGSQWLASLRQDFAVYVSAREQLMQTDAAFVRVTAELPRTASQFNAFLRRGESSVANVSLSIADLVPVVVGVERIATVQDVESKSSDSRGLMTAITALALLVLAALSITLALRIVRPVERLTRATRKLADGELDVRVETGGIRELDSLAQSFNWMADRVAHAQRLTQDAQRQLEERVLERTQQLQHLAERDPLTELPNRRQLFAELEAALQEASLHRHHVGVLVLDLDNFKTINDSMGHGYGDQVLQSIAKRLEEVVGDLGFTARLGGDEFTVVIEKARHPDRIAEAGQAIIQAFQKPLPVDGRELSISLSMGASYFPTHARDAEALLRAADAALFRAKALGRNQLSVFSPELLAAAASRFATEQGLRQAIESREFELAFQPEVHADTMHVPLVEALLRWRLPDGRLASTADFLTVAEESGLITQISDWVLRSAIAATAAWHHGGLPTLRVAINVSPRQLLEAGFVDRVSTLLKEHSLPPECIEIELTENVLQTGAATIEALHRLRKMGIGIALDDFGTGFSSLASLEQLPLTRVKLDRSLIASIDTSSRSLAIAQAIVGLCDSLGLEITAEGIERPEQLALLLRHRNLYLQGYLLSRPVAGVDLPRTLAEMPGRMESLLLMIPPHAAAAPSFTEVELRQRSA